MTLVYNYNKDVTAAAFIGGLQVTNPSYKQSSEERYHQDEGYTYPVAEVHPDRRDDSDHSGRHPR